MLPKIALQVIAYGVGDDARQDLANFFASCAAIQYPRDRWCIVVIDNPSPQGTLRDEIRREWIERIDVRLPERFLVCEETNTGFAGGHNAGLVRSKSWNADVVFLVNQDAEVVPDILERFVQHRETHPDDVIVQARIMLKQSPELLNTAGNAMHYLGFGFGRGYGEPFVLDAQYSSPMFYACGAAMFVEMSLIDRVGLFDSSYFMYHDDVDVCWRARLIGKKIGFASDCVALHRYEFSRSVKKFYWMERNRHLTNLTNYEFRTLLLIAPMMAVMEVGTLFFAFRSGWWREKLRAWRDVLKFQTLQRVWYRRKEIQSLRTVSDRVILSDTTSIVTHQDTKSFLMDTVANPVMTAYGAFLRRVIR